MLHKPFKPPFAKQPSTVQDDTRSSENSAPASKKRKLDLAAETLNSSARLFPAAARTPEPTESQLQPTGEISVSRYYEVLWRKFTTKKHKTWDGDGVLLVAKGFAQLQDDKGAALGRTKCEVPLLPGSTLSIAGLDVEIQSLLPPNHVPASMERPTVTGTSVVKEIGQIQQTSSRFNAKAVQVETNQPGHKAVRIVPPKSNSAARHFKTPLLTTTILPSRGHDVPTPRHDPTAPGALVMKRLQDVAPGKQIVDVVVDPLLTMHLRKHQREGVKFMYECVMGMQPHCGQGAILADEMGLGKTLQVITLLWTLLKQNPVYDAPPLIKKALIVCPVSLIKNWRKEFRKWLGLERIGVFILDGNRTKISDFTMGRSYNVMIVGYEKLRTIQDDLQKGRGIDIVIADEGHRLKTAQNKSAQAIKSLDTERRIILSGTPLQNDLSELYFMVDFVNPGLLGKANAFKRDFENPILKSRQPGASSRDLEKGKGRSEELAELTATCILRRTAEILLDFLPPKNEFVLFCRPTTIQTSLYRSVLASPVINESFRASDTYLQLINVLKKLCNSPSLLRLKDNDDSTTNLVDSLTSGIAANRLTSPGSSCKLQVLDSLLHTIKSTTNEKVVIVSHYTSTLDILQNLLSSLAYTWLRLDGSTPAGKRQELVDKFNRADAEKYFAFLLSAKSGGTGLNLIGASRLILFDIDWNPSTDLQAMARIHRDGQKKHCRIYRLITQGALDEKIYQRQLNKLSLADAIIDSKMSASSFTTEELRQLFTLDETSTCQTHDLLGCECPGRGLPDQHLAEIDGEGDKIGGNEPDVVFQAVGLLKKASEVDMESQEQLIRGERDGMKLVKSSKVMLMRYHHLDTRKMLEEFDQEEADALFDDAVLSSVVRDKESRVSFCFSKPGQ